MRGLPGLAAAAFLALGAVPGLARADLPARSERTLEYEIEASLDPATHEIAGKGRLTWRNDASGPAREMHLHLYLNAFRDEKSTFLRESRDHRGTPFSSRHPGGIDLLSFREEEGEERIKSAKFVAPDDANPHDRTVISIPLQSPVAPGERRTFLLAWKTRLPKVFARSGWAGDFHMAAQWFPKPGVFGDDPAGGEPCWNCHQYHGTSEFFADYGVYRVRIDVPLAYEGRVGATGALAFEEKDEARGRVTYGFVAEDVHDFAWVCDTDFVVREAEFAGGSGTASAEEVARLASLLGRPASDLALSPVRVRILLQPEHEDQAGRFERGVFEALTWMGLWFAPYPYPNLTVVDPDHRGGDAGGMEYPTLFTAWARYVPAERDWEPEFTIVHEFGHQHFYGLLASNEFEHAWMDEGMTTWATARVMAAAYPPRPPVERFLDRPVYRERPLPFTGWLGEAAKGTAGLAGVLTDDVRIPWGNVPPLGAGSRLLGVDPPDDLPVWPPFAEVSALSFLREVPPLTHLEILPVSAAEDERLWIAGEEPADPIVGRPAWRHVDASSYYANSYGRTAAALRTLEGLVGERTMLRTFREYAERHRFRHPVPEDFFAVAEETARADGHGSIDWFFDEAFRRAAHVDYAVESVDVTDGDRPEDAESVVTLRRHGPTRLPVDVAVRFDDGTERRFTWRRDGTLAAADGKEAPSARHPADGEQGGWAKAVFRGPARAVAAVVDPDRRIWLDADRTNDGRRADPVGRPSVRLGVRVLGWAEMSAAFYGGL